MTFTIFQLINHYHLRRFPTTRFLVLALPLPMNISPNTTIAANTAIKMNFFWLDPAFSPSLLAFPYYRLGSATTLSLWGFGGSFSISRFSTFFVSVRVYLTAFEADFAGCLTSSSSAGADTFAGASSSTFVGVFFDANLGANSRLGGSGAGSSSFGSSGSAFGADL